MDHESDSIVQQPCRSWWLRFLRRLLVACLVLLAAGLIYDAFGRAEWTRALGEACADGKPVTLQELEAARKVWSDDTNGARIILDLSDRLKAIQEQAQAEDLPIFRGRQSKMPEPPFGQRWDNATDQGVASRLNEWAAVLAQIDRLRDFKGGRFPMQITPCPFDILLPSLSPLRQSARLKSLDVTWRAMHGHTDSLPDDVNILLNHGRILADEPVLISQLVRVAIDSLTLKTIEDVCGQGDLPAARILAVERLLPVADAEYMGPGLRGERACFIGAAEYYRSGGDLSSVIGLPPRIPTWLPGVRGYLCYDQAVGVRMHNRIVAVADKPIEVIAEAGAWESQVEDMRFLSFTRVTLLSVKRAYATMVRAAAEMRCAQAALAAERYRIDTGSFPVKLDDLVPKYLDDVPLDPFDGRPLRYRLTSEQTCVYSVGDDFHDDGGHMDPSLPRTEQQDVGFRLLPLAMRGRAPTSTVADTPVAPSPH